MGKATLGIGTIERRSDTAHNKLVCVVAPTDSSDFALGKPLLAFIRGNNVAKYPTADEVSTVITRAADQPLDSASFEEILYAVGYVDCVYPTFYSALPKILALIESQPREKISERLREIARWLMFSIENKPDDSSMPQYEAALRRFVVLYCTAIPLESDTDNFQSLLIGLSASLKLTATANAIRNCD